MPKDDFHPSFCSRVVISTEFGHYLSKGSYELESSGWMNQFLRVIFNPRFSSWETQTFYYYLVDCSTPFFHDLLTMM